MEIAEIMSRFERFKGKFEKEAVQAAVERKQEIVPLLLSVLESIGDKEEALRRNAEEDYMAHIYAMFLLAQFREPAAFPLLLRFALLPGDLLDSLCGDMLTSRFGNILASVCDSNIEPIQALIENESVDKWVRSACLGSLLTLVAAGLKTRDEIVAYFATLFRGGIAPTDEHVISQLVCCATDLGAVELYVDLHTAFAGGRVDTAVVRFEQVKADLEKGTEWALKRLAESPHHHLIASTVEEMEWWASFHPEPPRERSSAIEEFPASLSTYRREGPKIGRNDLCPCGSGKKYKKCCGA